MTQAQTQQLPLFYQQPVPVTSERHGSKKLPEPPRYGFAAGTNAIPVNIDEFGPAARHYPILFAVGGDPFPIVLLGVRSEENLFIDAEGQWESGSYIPAYVRRYPFLFMTESGTDRLILCLDEKAEGLEAPEGRPFYEGGEAGPVLKEALNFCAAFHRRHQETLQFARALAERDLLLERAAQVTLNNGETMSLKGFSIINSEKLDQIPNKLFLDWRRKGWLPLIYAHMLSLQSWSNIVDRAAGGA